MTDAAAMGSEAPDTDVVSAVAQGSMPEAPGARLRPRVQPTAAQQEEIRGWARRAAGIASELKSEDIRILDMRELVTYTDFLVICTGRSSRQAKRIAEEVAFRLKKELGLVPGGVEGDTLGEWILLDYLDFIVHVFTPEKREFYRLDVLWKEAPVEVVS